MAIDYGTKRVGIASTDESGTFALPRIVLSNDKNLVEEIIKFKEKGCIGKVVIGESLDFTGGENPVMKQVRELGLNLREHGVEVVFHPEVLTTTEARQIQGNTRMTDASAAALILKSYLDSSR